MTIDISLLFYTGATILLSGSFIFLIAGLFWLKTARAIFGLMLLVPLVAGCAYTLMGLHIGFVSYAGLEVNTLRYLDWLITTPILLYVLSFILYPDATVRTRRFFKLLFLDLIMLGAGLGSELTLGNSKAILFLISGIAFIMLIYYIVDGLLRLYTSPNERHLRSTALLMAWTFFILWSAYPFVWILGTQGMQLFSLPIETTAYMLLDITTKLGFTAFLFRYLYLDSYVNN